MAAQPMPRGGKPLLFNHAEEQEFCGGHCFIPSNNEIVC
jgi:hypothetical protein